MPIHGSLIWNVARLDELAERAKDLPIFFAQQRDAVALRMAAFAVHNVGSIRVLEKCGFRTVPQENQQHADGVAEVLMTLGSK